MASRKLTLKRERLTELTTTELGQIVGGTHVACVTHGFSCDACPVPTLPVNVCLTLDTCVSGLPCAIADTVVCTA